MRNSMKGFNPTRRQNELQDRNEGLSSIISKGVCKCLIKIYVYHKEDCKKLKDKRQK